MSLQKNFSSEWKKADFIAEQEIVNILNVFCTKSQGDVLAVIEKGREAKGLTLPEVSMLLNITDDTLLEKLFAAAGEVKQKIYGRRIVLFAPLYISDYCINDCNYCGYRQDNEFSRCKLNQEEIREEVKILESMGHKRIALEAGEHPAECPIDYVLESLKTIYAIKFENGSIRRANINIAATTVEDYRKLKAAGIGTYILFQETYHRPTYEMQHSSGPKSDYDWHTTAHDRTMQGGIDDVGFGVLFGLYDYKFEVIAMLQHALHLEQEYGVGPHTISVPRLRPARGVDLEKYPYLVDDAQFAKIIAILRLAVPYTGIILSTRESSEFRDKLINHGVSQISAGSCTGVGGYKHEWDKKQGNINEGIGTPQFYVDDQRDTDEVIRSLCASGWLPSFCTACYRQGRTGDRFMALAKTGEIQSVCNPNAIMTFKEFLMDYASPELVPAGEKLIADCIEEIGDIKQKKQVKEELGKIANGSRDLYF